MLSNIFGSKRDEITGEWRRLHNKELQLYFSLNIIRVTKSRRMRWLDHVAGLGESRGAYRVLVGNLREKYHLEDPAVYERIILKCIFEKWDWRNGLRRSGLGQGQVVVSYVCGNKPSGSIKCWEFPEWLRNC